MARLEASPLSVGRPHEDTLSIRIRLLEDHCNFATVCLRRVKPNHHTAARRQLPHAFDVFLFLAFALQAAEFVKSVRYVCTQFQELGSA